MLKVFFLGVALFVISILSMTYFYRCIANGTKNINAFIFVINGMLAGLFGGITIFFLLDSTKGWNPFGWWFPASFLTFVAGGVIGVLIFGIAVKKKGKFKLFWH